MTQDTLIKQSESLLLSKYNDIVTIQLIDDPYDNESLIIFNHNNTSLKLIMSNRPEKLTPEEVATAIHMLIKL